MKAEEGRRYHNRIKVRVRKRERFEDITLLALKKEEGATSQGI